MKKFVLWGHHLKDYREMFDLQDDDLKRNILEFGCGATSFNAEMTKLGHHVTSCDPLFSQPKEELKQEVFEIFDSTVSELELMRQQFQLKSDDEIQRLVASRKQGIETFFADFDQGIKEKRYISCDKGKTLPFKQYEFGLGLINHYLFVNYADHGVDEHVSLIEDMVRVAGEVRVFPLLDKSGKISKLLGPVMLSLQKKQLGVEIRQVNSNLKRAGNAMLRVMTLQCEV